jgi:hypothetical protein
LKKQEEYQINTIDNRNLLFKINAPLGYYQMDLTFYPQIAKANNGYTVDSITRNGIGVMKQGDKKIIPLKGQSPASELNVY